MIGAHRGTSVIATISVATLLAGLGAATFSGSGSAAVSAGLQPNLPAARADAASLLDRVRLPAGATRSATAPSGSGSLLAMPATRLAGAVDDHRWWVVPVARDEVVGFVRDHPPAGSKLLFTGGGTVLSLTPTSTKDFSDIGFSLPPVTRVLGTRNLILTAVSLGAEATGVRADAMVQPVFPRPAGERVPSVAHRLVVVVERFGHRLQGPFSFTGRTRIARAAAALNALPAAQPGAVVCPLDTGVTIRLTFESARAGRPHAVAIYDPSGCGGVALTLNGRREPPLAARSSGSSRLINRLDSILGIRLGSSGAA
jgi:hypothetical protein